VGSLTLAIAGLFLGAFLAQSIFPTFPTIVIVPLCLNVAAGYLLIRANRTETGKVLLLGGTIASVALPFILL